MGRKHNAGGNSDCSNCNNCNNCNCNNCNCNNCNCNSYSYGNRNCNHNCNSIITEGTAGEKARAQRTARTGTVVAPGANGLGQAGRVPLG